MDLLVEGLDYLVSVTKQLLMTAKTRAKERIMFRGRSFWATGQTTTRQVTTRQTPTNVVRQELIASVS